MLQTNVIPTPVYPPVSSQLPQIFLSAIVNGISHMFWSLVKSGAIWYLYFPIAFIICYRLYKWYRLSKAGIFEIDKMTGPEFEERMAILFGNLGYKVEKTGKIGDYGVDLVVEKDGKRIAVQAKCYRSHVGQEAVREAYAGKNMYRCNEAMVVTNSNFTKLAWRLANKDDVKLWNRNYLVKVLLTEKAIQRS